METKGLAKGKGLYKLWDIHRKISDLLSKQVKKHYMIPFF